MKSALDNQPFVDKQVLAKCKREFQDDTRLLAETATGCFSQRFNRPHFGLSVEARYATYKPNTLKNLVEKLVPFSIEETRTEADQQRERFELAASTTFNDYDSCLRNGVIDAQLLCDYSTLCLNEQYYVDRFRQRKLVDSPDYFMPDGPDYSPPDGPKGSVPPIGAPVERFRAYCRKATLADAVACVEWVERETNQAVAAHSQAKEGLIALFDQFYRKNKFLIDSVPTTRPVGVELAMTRQRYYSLRQAHPHYQFLSDWFWDAAMIDRVRCNCGVVFPGGTSCTCQFPYSTKDIEHAAWIHDNATKRIDAKLPDSLLEIDVLRQIVENLRQGSLVGAGRAIVEHIREVLDSQQLPERRDEILSTIRRIIAGVFDIPTDWPFNEPFGESSAARYRGYWLQRDAIQLMIYARLLGSHDATGDDRIDAFKMFLSLSATQQYYALLSAAAEYRKIAWQDYDERERQAAAAARERQAAGEDVVEAILIPPTTLDEAIVTPASTTNVFYTDNTGFIQPECDTLRETVAEESPINIDTLLTRYRRYADYHPALNDLFDQAAVDRMTERAVKSLDRAKTPGRRERRWLRYVVLMDSLFLPKLVHDKYREYAPFIPEADRPASEFVDFADGYQVGKHFGSRGQFVDAALSKLERLVQLAEIYQHPVADRLSLSESVDRSTPTYRDKRLSQNVSEREKFRQMLAEGRKEEALEWITYLGSRSSWVSREAMQLVLDSELAVEEVEEATVTAEQIKHASALATQEHMQALMNSQAVGSEAQDVEGIKGRIKQRVSETTGVPVDLIVIAEG